MPIVQGVLEQGSLPLAGVSVPGEAEHLSLVAELVARTWRAGQRDGLQEVHREVRFDDPLDRPLPADALEFLRQRQALQGKWSRDLDAEVTKVLVHALSTGADVRTTMRGLQRVFPEFGKARLENIARTEATTAYNQGRLAAFREDKEFVTGVQFHAILDSRTTTICQARNGLVMRLDDGRLPANTPPLHYQCRSVLVPVDRIVWAKLEQGDRKAEEAFFGYLQEGPRNLTEALAGWANTPAPLPGFGDVQDVGKKPAEKPKKPRKPRAKKEAKPLPERVRDAWGTDAVDPTDLQRIERVGQLLLDEAKSRTKDIDTLIDIQKKVDQVDDQIKKLDAERLRFRKSNPEAQALDAQIPQKLAELKRRVGPFTPESEIDRLNDELSRFQKEIGQKVDALWQKADPQAWKDLQAAQGERDVAVAKRRIIANDVASTVREVTRDARPGTAELATSRKTKADLVAEVKSVVADVFPADWVQASNRVSTLPVGEVNQRGVGGHYSIPVDRVTRLPDHTQASLRVNPSLWHEPHFHSIVAHEFGHRVESVVPIVDAVFKHLYEVRTKGERWEPLTNYNPGAPKNLQIKRDAWVHPYVGLRPYDDGGSEVFSSGVEFLQGEKIAEFLVRDPEHLRLVLGAMAVL